MVHYEVKVIKPGYATWIGPTQQRADGSITLCKGPKNIIVDTGIPIDRQFILRQLKKEGVDPQSVDYVICTHGHSDHISNNNLFPNATFIVSYDVCKGDLYTFHDFASGQPYKIDEYAEVIPTPGHTKQDISLLVRTIHGIVAITGDLFENKDDFQDDSLWRAFSELPEEQEKSRKYILEHANFIVPGHGEMFEVKQGRLVEHSAKPPTGNKKGFVSKVFLELLIGLIVAIVIGIITWVWQFWIK